MAMSSTDRSPFWAGERIRDVGEHPHVGCRAQPGEIDGRDVCEAPRAASDRNAGGIEEPRAEGREHPGASIGGRAGADADDEA